MERLSGGLFNVISLYSYINEIVVFLILFVVNIILRATQKSQARASQLNQFPMSGNTFNLRFNRLMETTIKNVAK